MTKDAKLKWCSQMFNRECQCAVTFSSYTLCTVVAIAVVAIVELTGAIVVVELLVQYAVHDELDGLEIVSD